MRASWWHYCIWPQVPPVKYCPASHLVCSQFSKIFFEALLSVMSSASLTPFFSSSGRKPDELMPSRVVRRPSVRSSADTLVGLPAGIQFTCGVNCTCGVHPTSDVLKPVRMVFLGCKDPSCGCTPLLLSKVVCRTFPRWTLSVFRC
jgi:hypothetical protein